MRQLLEPEARTIASQLYPSRRVRRAPLPLKPLVDRFVRGYRIDACVLEYLELYPAWVHSMHHLNKPIGVVNGRVTEKSLRITWLLRSPQSDSISSGHNQTKMRAWRKHWVCPMR